MSEDDRTRLEAEAVSLADAVLAGKLSPILGARRILAVLRKLAISEDDDDLRCFALVDSETDALPIGPVREEWASDALRRKEPDIARAEAWARSTSEAALRNVQRRWS